MFYFKTLMRVEDFEISTLKGIEINISETDQLNWNFVRFLFSKSRKYNIKTIKFRQLIWQLENSKILSPSVPKMGLSC